LALTRWFAAICISLTVLLTAPLAGAQPAEAALNLPDVPQASPQQTSPNSPTATPATHSDSQTSAAPASGSAEESERQKAQEQLNNQLHQRVFGVMATFNTTRNRDALPLSTGRSTSSFSGARATRGPSCSRLLGRASIRPKTAFLSTVKGWKGLPSDGARVTPTTLPAICWEMPCWQAC
jgi:hypothetical protein